MTRLWSQGYKYNCMSITLNKVCGRQSDLVGKYKKNVCKMLDSISQNDLFLRILAFCWKTCCCFFLGGGGGAKDSRPFF